MFKKKVNLTTARIALSVIRSFVLGLFLCGCLFDHSGISSVTEDAGIIVDGDFDESPVSDEGGVPDEDAAVTDAQVDGGMIRCSVPDAPVLHPEDAINQIAFNNILQNSTTPVFRASATCDGDFFDTFQLELNTASDFSGSSYTETFQSGYAPGARYNLKTTDALGLPTTGRATYYVRVRASADGGNTWSDPSTTNHPIWTFTYKSSGDRADWFQTTDEQFNTGTLDDTKISGSNSVELSNLPDGESRPVETLITSTTIQNTSGNYVGSFSYNHDHPYGSNLCIVFVRMDPVRTLSVTYGGNPMTSMALADAAGDTDQITVRGEAFYLFDPPVGQNNVAVTISGGNGRATTFAYSLTDITSIRYSSTNNGTDQNTMTLDIPSVAGDLVLDFYGWSHSAESITDWGVGQTGIDDQNVNGQNSRGASSWTEATGNPSSNSATKSNTNGTWYALGMSFESSSVAGKGTILSPPVQFRWVPGRTNWGSVEVEATTKIGNSITVQVLNATKSPINQKSCTVQDGAVSCLIDLSDLVATGDNATLYLSATLNYGGGDTPRLNNWMVKWD